MAVDVRKLAARLEPFAPAAVVVAIALFIAWAFAATTLAFAGPMGLPLDDSYIYLTYAKQFGRAEPFSYFPGGGYSAGSTSVLWPMLLAPFWTLGARGHALVWVSFGMCAVLYAAVAVGCYRFVRVVRGFHIPGVLCAVMLLVIAPFAWCSLSGMEVAFAATLLVASILLLMQAPSDRRPSWLLITCLAATSLSRPEATLIVVGIVGVSVIHRMRLRAWRAAAWWLVPLAAPVVWLAANRIIAGNFFPNTGVAKSHFYLPGFDWTYWWDIIGPLTSKLMRGLVLEKASPLVWPRLVLVLFIIGAVRIGWWAVREKKYLVGALVVLAPFAMLFAVIASSGLWNFQNYRYIAPAFPLLFIPVGIALTPPSWMTSEPLDHRKTWRWAIGGLIVVSTMLRVTKVPFATGISAALAIGVVSELSPPWLAKVLAPAHRWLRRAWLLGAIVLVVLFVRAARPALLADMKLFAQGAMDTNTQVVAIGKYINRKLPDASIMFHDAGAIAYYGDGRVYDMLGLVTNHQAGIANSGPGARFEFLESLPPEQRPTHFAYYPGWMGTHEYWGDVVMHTGLRRGIEPRRLVGEADMQIIVANFDHAGTAERPLTDHSGWRIVDRIDVANIASERAHDWRGRMGRRRFGDPTARWSIVERSTVGGLYIDGGRTIRGAGERFTVRVDPAKPTRIVMRSGGQKTYGWHETISTPVDLTLYAGDNQLGKLIVPAPEGAFLELTFEVPAQTLPAGEVELRAEASGIYRVFHWFVLQPE